MVQETNEKQSIHSFQRLCCNEDHSIAQSLRREVGSSRQVSLPLRLEEQSSRARKTYDVADEGGADLNHICISYCCCYNK